MFVSLRAWVRWCLLRPFNWCLSLQARPDCLASGVRARPPGAHSRAAGDRALRSECSSAVFAFRTVLPACAFGALLAVCLDVLPFVCIQLLARSIAVNGGSDPLLSLLPRIGACIKERVTMTLMTSACSRCVAHDRRPPARRHCTCSSPPTPSGTG